MVETFNFVIEETIKNFIPQKRVGKNSPIKYPKNIRMMGKGEANGVAKI
jgi:hypothetical protein